MFAHFFLAMSVHCCSAVCLTVSQLAVWWPREDVEMSIAGSLALLSVSADDRSITAQQVLAPRTKVSNLGQPC